MSEAPLAVVTGASSGIGLAITESLLRKGWRVAAVSRSEPSLSDAGLSHIPCDLSDPGQVGDALDALEAWPAPRALVHAAGLQYSAHLGAEEAVASERMWRVHVAAAEQLANGLTPRLVDGGRIILIGSRTAVGVAGKSQYGATKAALSALARSWAAELAPRRITVNVVAPGPTKTPMLSDPRRSQTPPVRPPLGRLIEPDEVAQLAQFLIDPSGDMITGQTIVICGGTSLS